MPIQRSQLATGEIYHIVLRGVEQRDIFLDENDYYRGIFSIYEFNTTKLITIRERRIEREQFKKKLKELSSRCQTPGASRSLTPEISEDYERDLLVEVLTFCLMPNHIHLLLRQLKDNGISKFIQKMGTGLANYFNKKYSRVGHLFQGRFRSVYIKDNGQLKNAFVYVHTNPIALIEPGWKEKGIAAPQEAIRFIESYKWSSYLDYIGRKNFPSVTEREFLSEAMGGENGCANFVDDWINYKGEIATLGEVLLE